MSGRVVHIGRAAGGGVLRQVRVVGERTTESWDAAVSEHVDPVDAIDQARSAAKWIVERLKASDARQATIVVDVDGASCSWLTVPSAEALVVAAAMEHSENSPLGENSLMPPGVTGEGASVQAIGVATDVAGDRRAILCMPDAIVRILLDELDALGIVPQAVLSMWHAISLAWDPAAAADGGARQDRVVAESEQVTGVVVIEEGGVLMWSWAGAGRLITCGRQRLDILDDGICVEGQDISRLASDWLSWSLQNGQGPSRIVCVVPALSESGLTAAEIGRRLGDAWPDASVSMGVVDAPGTETLERLASLETGPPESISTLVDRPGRVHRRMHLAMACAALAVGLLLGVHGWSQTQVAKNAKAESRQIGDAIFQRAQEVMPDIQRMGVINQVDAEFKRLTGAGPDTSIEPAAPILEELGRILFALSITGVEWRNLQLLSGPTIPVVSFDAFFDPLDIEGMDLLEEQLELMPGSALGGWGRGNQRSVVNRIQMSFQAEFEEEAAR